MILRKPDFVKTTIWRIVVLANQDLPERIPGFTFPRFLRFWRFRVLLNLFCPYKTDSAWANRHSRFAIRSAAEFCRSQVFTKRHSGFCTSTFLRFRRFQDLPERIPGFILPHFMHYQRFRVLRNLFCPYKTDSAWANRHRRFAIHSAAEFVGVRFLGFTLPRFCVLGVSGFSQTVVLPERIPCFTVPRFLRFRRFRVLLNLFCPYKTDSAWANWYSRFAIRSAAEFCRSQVFTKRHSGFCLSTLYALSAFPDFDKTQSRLPLLSAL